MHKPHVLSKTTRAEIIEILRDPNRPAASIQHSSGGTLQCQQIHHQSNFKRGEFAET